MDMLANTIACAAFIAISSATAQDDDSLLTTQSTDFLDGSGPSAMESFSTGVPSVEPGPLHWADASDAAGLTRQVEIAHTPYFQLGPSTPILSGDYLFGPQGASHPSVRAQDPGRGLTHASTALLDIRPSWSLTPSPGSEPLPTLKGATGHLASCGEQAQPWSIPEGPHTSGLEHSTWDPDPATGPHCAPRYLSSLF
jgi:hypothetical protein